MGYQLVFWQQDHDTPPASAIYRSLCDHGVADGLRPLPVPSILAALVEEFPGIDPVPAADGPCPVFWEDDGQTSVEFWWSAVHVGAELRPAGSWSGDIANRVIDVLRDFRCPLYDPQTGERFDSWLMD